jgi:FHS family glucose/mannose:H+ symporter-like MFS transporter
VTTPGPRRSEIVAVYAAGLFQGLSLVAVPAAATVLTSAAGYDLSASQYGLLFLPQVILAIAGSLALPSLAGRIGLKRVLLIGLFADTVAMTLLVISNSVRTDAGAFPMLLVATGSLGLGFGLTLGSISTYAGAFQPQRREVALTALNVLLGLGTALSPLLVAVFLDIGEWWYLPLGTAVGLAVVLILTVAQPLVAEASRARGTARPPIPTQFWLFAAALVAYGAAETMFGNWGTTLLVDDGVQAATATYALAAFWAAVTVGRLVIAVISDRVGSTHIYVVLPWVIAVALLLAPTADSGAAGIALFALAGLACSGFFPMTIGYGESSFPGMVELAAGWLIAAYQIGYGLAAFGGGALQEAISLSTLFRITTVLVVFMGVLSLPIARAARPPAPQGPVARFTPSGR